MINIDMKMLTRYFLLFALQYSIVVSSQCLLENPRPGGIQYWILTYSCSTTNIEIRASVYTNSNGNG
jgi:hypothetical protein